MKLNRNELALFAVASLMIAAILYTTYTGYGRGGLEQNPIARFLFEMLYRYTGSWAAAILGFIPIAVIGLYIATALIKRDYQTKNPRAGQIFLSAFVLLVIPNTINNLFGLMQDNRLIATSGIALAVVYLVYEWLRSKMAVNS